MHHTREEVLKRAIKEFELLDQLVSNLTDEQWERLVPRPEGKDPWTVKDALAHIIYWKADVARSARGQRQPVEMRGLQNTPGNHLIYMRWHDRSPQEILSWHRQVQEDLLAALKDAPEEWFSKKDRKEDWPSDLDGHSAYHRINDIEKALMAGTGSGPARS